jgi:hypothetical protein
MHNIHIRLSQLYFIDGVIIFLYITIQDICKANFIKGLLELVTPISKHNITKKQTQTLCIEILQQIFKL